MDDKIKAKRASRSGTVKQAARPKGKASSPTAAPEDMWREIIAERLAYNSYREEPPANVAASVTWELHSAVNRARLGEKEATCIEFLRRLAYDVIANGHTEEVLRYVGVHAAESATKRERTQGGRARWLWIVESRCGWLGVEDQPLDEAAATRAIARREAEAKRASDNGLGRDDRSISVPVPRILFLAETLKRDLAAVDSQANELGVLQVVARLNAFVSKRGSKRPTPVHALAAKLAADCGAFDEDEYEKQRDAFRDQAREGHPATEARPASMLPK